MSKSTNADQENTAEKSNPKTGAQAVVASLEEAGVRVIFGVQGGAIMPVYDALYDSKLEHITMGHEQGAAHAADAYGIVSGQPGVCIATSGPGATNLITGLADANMDSVPVLALTGQVPTNFVGNDAFQECDTIGGSNPVTKANFFATESETVGDLVSLAFLLAREGRQGPTLVDLPKDVTLGEVSDWKYKPPKLPDHVEIPDGADVKVVESAATALIDAKKPVILAGGGVIKGNACEQLYKFATEFEIPVVTTMPGIGSFPEDHELSLKPAGMHGTGYANMALTHCDVMLAVGTRFDDRLTGGVDTFAPTAEIIHIDIDPAEISKNIHADYELVGDAATVLSQLHKVMQAKPNAEEWLEQIKTWKQEYSIEYGERESNGKPRPQYIIEQLCEATESNTIVTTGVGQHQMWAMLYWTYKEPRTWVSSHGLGTMGYGLPAAIGARFAASDDQKVVCIDGDGSFLMTLQELSVAVREELDITVVVLNNAGIGMVRQWQDAFYGHRRMASEYPWVPDFSKIADAFGAKGFLLENVEDVESIIREAIEYKGPSVIDARIDPAENVFPMVPSGGANGLFALTEEHLEEL